jgi:hypothetical protein
MEDERMTEKQIIQITGIEEKTSFTSSLTWNPHHIRIWDIGNSIVLEFFDIKDEGVSVIFPDRESLASALKEVLKQIGVEVEK